MHLCTKLHKELGLPSLKSKSYDGKGGLKLEGDIQQAHIDTVCFWCKSTLYYPNISLFCFSALKMYPVIFFFLLCYTMYCKFAIVDTIMSLPLCSNFI